MALDIGRVAYQAFYEQLINKQVTPKWEDLSKAEADAWRHAAVAVLHYDDEMKKQMEENPDLIG